MNNPNERLLGKLTTWWEKHRYPFLPLSLWLFLSLLTTFLFPREGSYKFTEFSLDSISRVEIIAPFSFNVEYSKDELKQKREAALETIEPVWTFDDSVLFEQQNTLRGCLMEIQATWNRNRDVFDRFGENDTVSQHQFEDSLGLALSKELESRFSVSLSHQSWLFLTREILPKNLLPRLERDLESIFLDISSRGILPIPKERLETADGKIRLLRMGEESSRTKEQVFDKKEALDELLDRLRRSIFRETRKIQKEHPDEVTKLGYEILIPRLVPNLIYDESETEFRRQQAINRIPIVKTIVLKGERIVDSNERITEEQLEKLHWMEKKRIELSVEHGGFDLQLRWLGRFALVGMIFFMVGYWIFRFKTEVYNNPRYLMFLVFLLTILILFYGVIILPLNISNLLFPAALGAIIVTIILNPSIAFLFIFTLTFIIGALKGAGYFPVLEIIVPALLSVFAVIRVRARVQILRASLLIFLGLFLVISIHKLILMNLGMDIMTEYLYAGINAIATPLISLGLLIVVEWIFGVTTDLTLLELGDLNRPLLKRLSMEAPGTYHHSIMVGNLSEAAAEAIDANPLLVRAGAYYHDIGKMLRREYFVENQRGSGNIHDTLKPEESAKYLRAHVLDGIKLAREYHLPEAIKAFIREHHGTSLMAFFYHKALQDQPPETIDESLYRYPGPKPQSKETALLMLADASEATTRSLDNPDSEEIQRTLREVIINKYRDRELDECDLTLGDLQKVMAAFLPILEGIHHHRIKYPKRPDDESNS